MEERVEGMNIWGLVRFVIRRVLEGGLGVIRGGREESDKVMSCEGCDEGVEVGDGGTSISMLLVE